jgi:hypothetical protein
MSILKTGRSSSFVRAGASVALAAAAVGGFATTSQAAGTTTAQQAVTLSTQTGPQAGGSLTMTIPSTAATKFVSGSFGVQFQNVAATATASATNCATNPVANAAGTAVTVVSTTVRILSTTKAAFTYPTLAGGTPGPYWLACVYNAPESSGAIASTATVIGRAVYLAAGAPTATLVSPAQGPATGGQTITVTGTNFPTSLTAATPLTATLGGVALTNITPVSATKFTATTPAVPVGAVNLQVTTAGGSVTATGLYTYANGLTVSPNTLPQASTVDVDVTGTGFSTLTFSATDTAGTTTTGAGATTGTNSAGPHVYLMASPGTAYNASAWVANTTNKGTSQTSECVSPIVISDSELICTVDTGHTFVATTGNYVWTAANVPTGVYQLLVVDKGNAAGVAKSVFSSGAVFSVSPF